MWCLLALLAFAQPVDEPVSIRNEALWQAVIGAEKLFERWEPDLPTAAQRADRAVRLGADPTDAADALMTILAALNRSVTELEAGFEQSKSADPPPQALTLYQDRLLAIVQENRAVLVKARLFVVTEALRRRDVGRAQLAASTLQAELNTLVRRGGDDPRIQPVQEQIRRVLALRPEQLEGVATADLPEPVAAVSADHLRWRLSAQWTVPVRSQQYEFAGVRRDPLSGGIGLAIAPEPAYCAEVRALWDRWTVPEHAYELVQTRWRIEAGYCPRLVSGRVRSFTVGLRAVVGVGLAGGRARQEGSADLQLLGIGGHGRVEALFQRGRFEFSPSVGVAPYGRASPGNERVDWPFVQPITWGLSVGIGGQPIR